MSGRDSRRGKEPGEFDRFADHGPVARVDVGEVKVLGLGELGHVTGADPLLSLGGGEFGAYEDDRDVEPPLVRQTHHALGYPFGDGDRSRRDAAPGLLVKVSRVWPLEWAPAGEGHDAVLRLEEVGVGLPVGRREADDESTAASTAATWSPSVADADPSP